MTFTCVALWRASTVSRSYVEHGCAFSWVLQFLVTFLYICWFRWGSNHCDASWSTGTVTRILVKHESLFLRVLQFLILLSCSSIYLIKGVWLWCSINKLGFSNQESVFLLRFLFNFLINLFILSEEYGYYAELQGWRAGRVARMFVGGMRA